MKKVELCYKDDLHPPFCHWNGYLFDQLLKDCAKNNLFPNVAKIGEIQEYINDYIKKEENKKQEKENISRNTFHQWRTDGGIGPNSDYTKFLLDRLFSNIRFLRRPCTKAKKEKLFEVYNLAWLFHYECPLLVEAEVYLYDFIEQVEQESFNKKYVAEILNEMHNEEYDDYIKEYPEDLYLCELLTLFWEGYHQILIDAGIEDTLYGVLYNEEILPVECQEESYQVLDDNFFREKYKDVLLQRQQYLEGFADNLRTLFLGEDL